MMEVQIRCPRCGTATSCVVSDGESIKFKHECPGEKRGLTVPQIKLTFKPPRAIY
jgi:hypothetical protein